MANTTNKFQYPRPSFKHLSAINYKNRRVGAEHFRYGEDYMGKLLKVPDFINVNKRVK